MPRKDTGTFSRLNIRRARGPLSLKKNIQILFNHIFQINNLKSVAKDENDLKGHLSTVNGSVTI